MNLKNIRDLYEIKGLINVRKHPTEDLYLTCYSKKCFFEPGNWDSYTMNARGHVYDGDGFLVSNVFPKIFNVGEHESVEENTILSKLSKERHTVYDKINGHLCILFNYNGKWYNHTKGSWTHEFVQLDRELLESEGIISRLDKHGVKGTFIFEIVADYDQHVLSNVAERTYGRNKAVLLGGYQRINPLPRWWLEDFCRTLKIPIVKPMLITGPMETWYNEKNTEGFVVHFYESDFRVKIKTKDFLEKRYRYYSEKNAENYVKKLFKSYGLDANKVKEELDEEFYPIYDKVVEDYHNYGEFRLVELKRRLADIYPILLDDPYFIFNIVDPDKGHLVNLSKGRGLKDDLLQKQFLVEYDFENLELNLV